MREQREFQGPEGSVRGDSFALSAVTGSDCFGSLAAERTRYGRFELNDQALNSRSGPLWSSTQSYAAALGIAKSKLANLLIDPDRSSSAELNAQLAHRIFREEIAPAAIAGLMGLCGRILCRGRGADDLVTFQFQGDGKNEKKLEGLQIKLVPLHGSLFKQNIVGHQARAKTAAVLRPGGGTRLLLIPVNASRIQLIKLFVDLASFGAEPQKISVIHPQILHLAGSPLFVNKSKLCGPPENLQKLNLFMQACARAKGEQPPLPIEDLTPPETRAIKSAARIIERSIGFQDQLLKAAIRQKIS